MDPADQNSAQAHSATGPSRGTSHRLGSAVPPHTPDRAPARSTLADDAEDAHLVRGYD